MSLMGKVGEGLLGESYGEGGGGAVGHNGAMK